MPALPSASALLQLQVSDSVQLANHASQSTALGTISNIAIAHGPDDSSVEMAASVEPATAASATMQELHSALGSHQPNRGFPSNLSTWLSQQNLARPAPVPLPQDAFESGELVPGAFSPLGTALMHMQAAQVGLQQSPQYDISFLLHLVPPALPCLAC